MRELGLLGHPVTADILCICIALFLFFLIFPFIIPVEPAVPATCLCACYAHGGLQPPPMQGRPPICFFSCLFLYFLRVYFNISLNGNAFFPAYRLRRPALGAVAGATQEGLGGCEVAEGRERHQRKETGRPLEIQCILFLRHSMQRREEQQQQQHHQHLPEGTRHTCASLAAAPHRQGMAISVSSQPPRLRIPRPVGQVGAGQGPLWGSHK